MDIVLIPGLWLDEDSWQDVTPVLEQAGHRVRIVPSPGLGVPAPSSEGIGMQDWVDAIVAEIDASDGRVVLVGHSGGGNAAWGGADKRADRVARVVFVDTAPPPPGAEVSEFEVVDGVIPFPGWDSFDEPDVADLDEAIRERWAPRTASVPAKTPTDGIVLDDDARFGIPVTLLMGPFDEAQFREAIRQWGPHAAEFEAIRDSAVVKLDSGHWPQFSKPATLAAAIVAVVGEGDEQGPDVAA